MSGAAGGAGRRGRGDRTDAPRHRGAPGPAVRATAAGRGRGGVGQLSNWRFVLGVAPGYVAEEFAAYAVPREERHGRFEEALDLMQTAWTEDRFSFDGRFYQVQPETQVTPKPVQRPLPIWYGVSGPKTLRRAVRGATLIGSPRHGNTELKEHYAIYEDEASKTGFEIPERPLIREVFVAETQQKAEEIAAPAVNYLFCELYGAKSAAVDRKLRTDSGELVTAKEMVDFENFSCATSSARRTSCGARSSITRVNWGSRRLSRGCTFPACGAMWPCGRWSCSRRR